MNTLNRPPFPGNNLNEWARRMYDYLSSQSPVKGTVEPVAVLLPHIVDEQMPRAATEGILLFDPATSKVVVSIGGAFEVLGPADAVVIPDLAGDVTGPIGSNALVEVNNDAGTWGDANTVPQITVDAKGRITNVVNVAISDATLSTDITDSTVAGRAMLTAADAAAQTALLDVFTSVTDGLVPASGGDSADFLCADGSFKPKKFYGQLAAAYNLANSGAVQKLFNFVANGAITLDTGVYEVIIVAAISNMSATSGNGVLSLAGTATRANERIAILGADSNSFPAAASISSAGSSSAAIAVGATTQQVSFVARIIVDITASGTVIPSIQLANAAAAIVSAGSYITIERLGDTGERTRGNWS